MNVTVQLTLEQLQNLARKAGLSDKSYAKLTIHDVGGGRISITAYPGNPEGTEFLKNLDVPFAVRRE